MTRLNRAMAGLAVASALALTPAVAMADAPLGMYQTYNREMDYDLRLCGPKEDQLCVTLLDARGGSRGRNVRPWIGKEIISNARPAGENRWKGRVHYGKYTIDGTLELNPGKTFKVSGCTMIVVCADFTLIPALETTAAQ